MRRAPHRRPSSPELSRLAAPPSRFAATFLRLATESLPRAVELPRFTSELSKRAVETSHLPAEISRLAVERLPLAAESSSFTAELSRYLAPPPRPAASPTRS